MDLLDKFFYLSELGLSEYSEDEWRLMRTDDEWRCYPDIEYRSPYTKWKLRHRPFWIYMYM
eukprot:SAG11_NODE_20122_length_452_cov_1.019830_2_plen_60_part_01